MYGSSAGGSATGCVCGGGGSDGDAAALRCAIDVAGSDTRRAIGLGDCSARGVRQGCLDRHGCAVDWQGVARPGCPAGCETCWQGVLRPACWHGVAACWQGVARSG